MVYVCDWGIAAVVVCYVVVVPAREETESRVSSYPREYTEVHLT